MIRVIRPSAPGGALPLLIVDVALLWACFYAAAEYLYPPSAYYYLFLEGGVTLAAIAIATIVLAMYFFDLYADFRSSSRIVLLQQLCQALGVAIIAQTVAIYLFRDWTVPHLMMIYSCLLALAVLFVWRLAFAKLIESVAVHGKLLFLGRSSLRKRWPGLLKQIRKPVTALWDLWKIAPSTVCEPWLRSTNRTCWW